MRLFGVSPVALEFFPGNPDRQYRQLRNFYLFWTVDHVMYRFAVIYSTSSLEHFDVCWDGTAGKPSHGMKAWALALTGTLPTGLFPSLPHLFAPFSTYILTLAVENPPPRYSQGVHPFRCLHSPHNMRDPTKRR